MPLWVSFDSDMLWLGVKLTVTLDVTVVQVKPGVLIFWCMRFNLQKQFCSLIQELEIYGMYFAFLLQLSGRYCVLSRKGAALRTLANRTVYCCIAPRGTLSRKDSFIKRQRKAKANERHHLRWRISCMFSVLQPSSQVLKTSGWQ